MNGSQWLIYLACLLLVACSSDGASSVVDAGAPTADADSETDGQVPEVDTSSEDVSPPPVDLSDEPGAHQAELLSGGLERTFTYTVPRSYDRQNAHPLLLVFHGGDGSGSLMRALGFGAHAEGDAAIVVYPDGVDNNWSDGRGTTDAELAGVDDVGFVSELIDAFDASLSVDTDRVWATGPSNGGMFSHRLACDLSDRIAAVAPVIAALPTQLRATCAPARPIAMLAIQGTDDPFITFEGGDAAHDDYPNLGAGGEIESAEATMQFWAQQNSCDTPATIVDLEPIDEADATRVTRHEYRGCDGGALIDYHIVAGMGHTWPPREAQAPRISGPTSTQLDATELIWEFLRDKTR